MTIEPLTLSTLAEAVHGMLRGAMWLTATIAIYVIARFIYLRVRSPLLNPAFITIGVLIIVLVATHTPYGDYASGGTPLSALLGPGVVALGVGLAGQFGEIRRRARAILTATVAGAATGIVAGAGVAALLHADPVVIRSLAARSVTTPIAMAITAQLGGIPALAALVSIASGLVGAVIGPPMLRRVGVTSRLATGLALGTAAHGLGTARAAEAGDVEGAASGMGMGLNGLVTALIAGAIARLL